MPLLKICQICTIDTLSSWIAETLQHLEQRNFEQLDIKNLLSEIENMGKSRV